MGIVENIRSLCKQSNTSIPKLGADLGFGNGAIYNWDKNSPSIDKVQKVANYFKVSLDRIIYGFELTEFETFVDQIRNGRSYEQFSNDTGVSLDEITDICMGLITKPPSEEVVRKIASSNPVDYLISEDDLLEAAGYISERKAEAERKRLIQELTDQFEEAGFTVRYENEDYYEKIYIDHWEHGTVASMFLHEFIDKGSNILKELTDRYKKYDIETIAAHHEGDEWTEEELKLIEDFKQFVRSQRKK